MVVVGKVVGEVEVGREDFVQRRGMPAAFELKVLNL